jgi:hypothetical protein
MKYLILTGLFVLASLTLGCASSGDLEANPQKSFSSNKTVDEFAGCLAQSWSTGPLRSPANYQVREFGAVVSLPGGGLTAVDAVATIKRTDSGVNVSYSERWPEASPPWMEQSVSQCL